MNQAAVKRMPVLGVVAVAMALLLAMTFGAGSAFADGNEINVDNIKAKSTQKMLYFPGKDAAASNVYYVFSGSDKAITKVKSSNKKVVAVSQSGEFKAMFQMQLKKAGKAKVTFKYKGKSYTMNVVVAKYTNPVKTYKIGSTNYASKFKKTPFYFAGGKVLKGKVTVKAATGWKFKHFEFYKNGKLKTAKTRKLTGSEGQVTAVMQHKKSGALAYVSVFGGM
ncbi:MAG: hypothetical protein Q4D27_07080 [Coriobacteriia bacterium]|nr:hypothetical protein [Coriobacteriia bacterium]